MSIRSMAKKTYSKLLEDVQTLETADVNFVRRLLRAVNSGASDLQSERLVNALQGRRIKTPKGTLVGLEQTYSHAYGGYIYAPIYQKA